MLIMSSGSVARILDNVMHCSGMRRIQGADTQARNAGAGAMTTSVVYSGNGPAPLYGGTLRSLELDKLFMLSLLNSSEHCIVDQMVANVTVGKPFWTFTVMTTLREGEALRWEDCQQENYVTLHGINIDTQYCHVFVNTLASAVVSRMHEHALAELAKLEARIQENLDTFYREYFVYEDSSEDHVEWFRCHFNILKHRLAGLEVLRLLSQETKHAKKVEFVNTMLYVLTACYNFKEHNRLCAWKPLTNKNFDFVTESVFALYDFSHMHVNRDFTHHFCDARNEARSFSGVFLFGETRAFSVRDYSWKTTEAEAITDISHALNLLGFADIVSSETERVETEIINANQPKVLVACGPYESKTMIEHVDFSFYESQYHDILRSALDLNMYNTISMCINNINELAQRVIGAGQALSGRMY